MDASPTHAAPRTRRVLPWVLGAVGLALVLWAGLLAWDAMHARSDAQALTDSAAEAQDAVTARDVEALQASVDDLSQAANDFAAHTSGPHWWLASQIPWVSDQVDPLQLAGGAVQALADEALAPLAQLENLDALANPEFVDGRIDPLMLEPYRPTLEQVADVLHRENETLAQADTTRTVPVVRDAFDDLTGQLESFTNTVDAAVNLAELLPTMLGGEGPRTYAVMLQNNAEPRATGGIPGAVIMVTVSDGRLQMGDYFSASDLNEPEPIDAKLSEEEQIAFDDLPVRYAQDVTLTPQFPRAAELLSDFVERRTGVAPDGVVSIDPVALGYMLADAPARDIGGISVSGDNLADVMLNEAYFAFPEPSDQDAFFALAAGALFNDLTEGGGAAVGGLQRALDEGRFAVWSADAAEQAILAPTSAGGDQLRDDVWAGVFLNDGSGSKIGYYASTDAALTVHQCEASKRITGATADISVTHGFDGDVADLPRYISGGGVYVPEGQFVANVMFLVPQGYSLEKLTVDGEDSVMWTGHVAGRQIAWPRVELDPGQTTHLTYTLGVVDGAPDVGNVTVTPGSLPDSNNILVDIDTEDC